MTNFMDCHQLYFYVKRVNNPIIANSEFEKTLDKIHSGVAGWYGLLINDSPLTYNIGSLNQSTGLFTCTVNAAGKEFKNGARVRFASTGAMPSGLLTGVDYYVIESNLSGLQNTFKVSTGANFNFDDFTGVPVIPNSLGSGTLSVTQQSLGRKDRLALWVQQESQYQGSGRQAIAIPPVVKDLTRVKIRSETFLLSLNHDPVISSGIYRCF
jgi:hypothetical protein